MTFEQALGMVAGQYRGEGYQVIVHPRGDQVPSLAAGYEPQLIALKNGEKALVVVKATQRDLREDTQILDLGRAVDSQSEWRLDLVVLNLGGPEEKIAANASEPPPERILASLATAEQMAQHEEATAAFVQSWAALEAALRHAARAAGIDIDKADANSLLNGLYSRGLLGGTEVLDRLKEGMKVRNALVRGLSVPDVGPSAVREVAAVARRLLAQNGKVATP
jgi:hypothetical protein